MIIHKVCLKKRICDYYHFIFILEQFEVIGGYFSVTLSIMKAYFAFCFKNKILLKCLIKVTFAHGLNIKYSRRVSLTFPPYEDNSLSSQTYLCISKQSASTPLYWKIGLKILSMAPPIRTRPSFPLSQSLPSGSFHKPLIFLHQRTDRLKTTIT